MNKRYLYTNERWRVSVRSDSKVLCQCYSSDSNKNFLATMKKKQMFYGGTFNNEKYIERIKDENIIDTFTVTTGN